MAAVPLAVDPKGGSAIMTGLVDEFGLFTRVKGKNVLWAYVCGDSSEDSPGNRVMVGHTATVVSAAWAKEGSTAVTGDADGRVIVWDAKKMKEARRVELGGRVMAVAISDDGTHTAAYVRGKRGAEVYVWQTAKPANPMKPIHTEVADFSSEPYAGLRFSRDGQRLAGCAIDKKWLQLDAKTRPGGKVRVWDLAAEPKAQPAPKLVYTKQLSKGRSPSLVIAYNHLMFTAATKEGAIDFRDLREGELYSRLVLGKFAIGAMKLSSDRKRLAIEQRPATTEGVTGIPVETFDIGVYDAMVHNPTTIPSCSQLLDVASGGETRPTGPATHHRRTRRARFAQGDPQGQAAAHGQPFRRTRVVSFLGPENFQVTRIVDDRLHAQDRSPGPGATSRMLPPQATCPATSSADFR
jgi:hypothetical protein